MGIRKKLGVVAVAMAFSVCAWGQEARFTIADYDLEGVTLVPLAQLDTLLAPHKGEGRSMEDVNAAAESVRKAYENAGYPVVKVFPPQQQTDSGVIRLKVIEGEIRGVQVKGNSFYDESNIRNSLPPLQEKAKPNAKRIIASIAAANENPAKQVAVNFQAADEVGQIDAVVNVTEDRPEKFTVGLDNTGSRSTGVRRLNLGYQNANLFNLDHMLSLQLGTSPDHPERSNSLSLGYRVPFYQAGLSLDVVASVSRSKTPSNMPMGLPGGGLQLNEIIGDGYTVGIRLNQALPSAGEYRHRLVYGFDYKHYDNECRGSQNGVIGKVDCFQITAQPLSLTYGGTLNRADLQLNTSVGYFANLPGGPDGGSGAYDELLRGAKNDWKALRLGVTAAVPLGNDFQFRAGFAGQYSESRLIPGEQFGLGGANSVRGYAERTISGDIGYSANLELYTPDFGSRISPDLSLRGVVFHDFGKISMVDRERRRLMKTNNENHLRSFGLGMRMGWKRDIAVKVDIGFPNKRYQVAPQGSGINRSKGEPNLHASFNLQF